MWKRAIIYGALLALGAVGLQWLDYQSLVRRTPQALYIGLMAAGFLALGVFVGSRLFRTPPAQPFDGNPQAQTALGISPRELTVLHELAAGQSNKEIARKLSVSPHTVKTHVARLYDKLEATRRTEAVRKARELGLIE